jgi:hypothetical protein
MSIFRHFVGITLPNPPLSLILSTVVILLLHVSKLNVREMKELAQIHGQIGIKH